MTIIEMQNLRNDIAEEVKQNKINTKRMIDQLVELDRMIMKARREQHKNLNRATERTEC